jgi:hypothetical protein
VHDRQFAHGGDARASLSVIASAAKQSRILTTEAV